MGEVVDLRPASGLDAIGALMEAARVANVPAGFPAVIEMLVELARLGFQVRQA